MTDDWRRRHMFSDEVWCLLTKHYPGLEKQPPAVSRMAFNIVEWETKRKHSYAPSLPSERRSAYLAANKKIRSAIDAMKAALDSGQSSFEILPACGTQDFLDRNNFFRNLISDLHMCEIAFMGAAGAVKPAKTGPNNNMLQTYVWMIAEWFYNNGRGDRISAGEDSYSIKVFIKEIFLMLNYTAPDRALADAIRSYQKKRG